MSKTEYLKYKELQYKIITFQRLSDEESEEHQKLQTKYEEWFRLVKNEIL